MALTLVALETMVTICLFAFGGTNAWGETSPGIEDGTSLENRPHWEQMEKEVDEDDVYTCVIDVENWTKFKFNNPLVRRLGSYIDRYPTKIMPGTREAFAVRTYSSGTMLRGTVSWRMQEPRRLFVVMFTISKRWGNYLGVGFTRKGLTRHAYGDRWWDQMARGKSSADLTFTRSNFDFRLDDITLSHEGFLAEGYMTNGNNARVILKVKPTADTWDSNAADSVKDLAQP